MLSAHPEGIRVAEASQELGVAPSTAHRLFQMLTHFELAGQDPASKAYLPGPALHGMALPQERFVQKARRALVELAEATQETVHLSVLEGNYSVTLLSVEGPHMLRVGDRAGNAISVRHGAMARCLLVGYDEPALRELLGGLPQPPAPEELDALVQRAADDRRRGYAYQEGEVEADVSVVAVPVFDEKRWPRYAVGTTFPTARVSKKQIPGIVERLQGAAASLGLMLRG